MDSFSGALGAATLFLRCGGQDGRAGWRVGGCQYGELNFRKPEVTTFRIFESF